MTNKQTAFINEYLKDLNATQAAIRAGYNPNTAKTTGHENLTKPYIRTAIDEALTKRAQKTQITHQDVINGLWQIATQGTSENARVKAYELVGKHHGMTFTDTTRHITDSVIEIDLTT